MAERHANFISIFGYGIIATNWTTGRTNNKDSVVNVKVISILLYSFSWLGLKQGPYIIQCSVQKSSKEYTCYSTFKSEGQKRNLLLASFLHFSWSHHLEYFNIVGIIYSQSVQNL